MTSEELLLHDKRLLERTISVAIHEFSKKTKWWVVRVNVQPDIILNGHVTDYGVSVEVRVP